jgi:hypothetical protein
MFSSGSFNLENAMCYVTWCKEPASFMFQRIENNGFVSCTLYINSSIEEGRFGRFSCNIYQTTVGKIDMFVAIEDLENEITHKAVCIMPSFP